MRGVDGPHTLLEFPADDPDRARRFWSDLLGVELTARNATEGRGWQTHASDSAIGIHARGAGPGDTASLPYFTVADIDAALDRVNALGGSVSSGGTGLTTTDGCSTFNAGDPSCAGGGFLVLDGAHNPRIMQFGLRFQF